MGERILSHWSVGLGELKPFDWAAFNFGLYADNPSIMTMNSALVEDMVPGYPDGVVE